MINVNFVRLSEEIDEEYEQERQALHENILVQNQQVQEEHDYIIFDEDELLNSTIDVDPNNSKDVSISRSVKARVKYIGVDVATQTDPAIPDRPKLRINKRVATDEIKSTCAQISSVCGVSVETSRKAVQITCSGLYKHSFYLLSEEQVIIEGVSSTLENYAYLIPSARTINDHKQIQASEMERDAAVALNNKIPNVKVTIHFDTTGRSSIDGEWPSIILKFSDGHEYRLRPLFFAYEDRQQITELFVETF